MSTTLNAEIQPSLGFGLAGAEPAEVLISASSACSALIVVS